MSANPEASTRSWTGLGAAADGLVGQHRRVGARRPLRVLLTNDDGWDAAGLQAVHVALLAAGHDVVVVAPVENQSGAGARVTFSGQMLVRNEGPGIFAVSGSPVDAAGFGLDVVCADAPPDLVVAGANNGQNVGAMALHSGTIGAVATALHAGVPGIAVSSEIDFETGAVAHDRSAAFTVDLIDELAARSCGGPLLPTGLGLSVNVPVVRPEVGPAEVALCPIGTGFVRLCYFGASLPDAPGERSTFNVGARLDVADHDGSDTCAFADNQITVSVIEPNFNATTWRPSWAASPPATRRRATTPRLRGSHLASR